MSPKPFRLILSPEQSAALAENGPRFSVCIVHPGSWPDNPRRHVLDLIETDCTTANAITAILKGEARAVKIKPTTVSKQ